MNHILFSYFYTYKTSPQCVILGNGDGDESSDIDKENNPVDNEGVLHL